MFFFLRLIEKRMANIKGVFRGFNKNFIKPKFIPSHSSQEWLILCFWLLLLACMLLNQCFFFFFFLSGFESTDLLCKSTLQFDHGSLWWVLSGLGNSIVSTVIQSLLYYLLFFNENNNNNNNNNKQIQSLV